MRSRPFTRVCLVAAFAVLAASCGRSGPAPRQPTTTTEPPARAVTELAPTPTSIGDPLAPGLGNGGYDVVAYDLAVQWKPKLATARITATVEAEATEALDTFTLDFAEFAIQSITVNGEDAKADLDRSKLTVTPASPIAAGDTFVTEVRYVGPPGLHRSDLARHEVGWTITDTGTVFVTADPDGTHLWAPVNDHPLDRATWRIEISAPTPLFGIASGNMTNRVQGPETTTTEWTTSQPVGPQAITLAIRDATLMEPKTSSGVDLRNLLPAAMADDPPPVLGKVDAMIDFLEQRLGPFPYDSYGIAVIDGISPPLPANTWSILTAEQLADENQAELRIVADLARHWFGDSATPRTWSEVWLSTSLPLYASWMWLENQNGSKSIEVVARVARSEVKDSAWQAPNDPIEGDIYGTATFLYGAVYLHALRLKIGDRAFFDLLRTLHSDHKGDVITTSDLVSETYRASGQDLRFYIDAWFAADPLPGFPDA
jgi:aminopeptidase N